MPKYLRYSRTKTRGIEWQKAPDVDKKIKLLVENLNISWVDSSRIISFRSRGTSTLAYARIWGLARIWQLALGLKPNYIIEVISEKFDRLESSEKDKVLLHELTHIPKNFSGSLVPHIRRGKRNFHRKVDELIRQYLAYKRRLSK